jgi:deazaflavin-dependent oxidoreductase (nitroreductase family)
MRLPQGNRLVLAILRSPVHRLLSRMALELRYTGRRSGLEYTLPVQYARDGDRLVILPQSAPPSTWWRNFRQPRPVTVRLVGTLRTGTAVVVEPTDPQWQPARDRYAARWRALAKRATGPLVIITLD